MLIENSIVNTVSVSKQGLQKFVFDILMASAAATADAQIVAEALVWSDLRGRHAQGVARLPIFIKRLQRGLIFSPAAMNWKALAPAIYLLDAGHGFGHVAGRIAMTKAVELAKGNGIGLVTVKHSNLYGSASYYCALASAADCIGFTCTNAVAKVAPYGGTRPVLGTNPLAFGSPTSSGVPILIDLSTSAIAGSSARDAGNNGNLLPEGVALDANGNPTRDPIAAGNGCLLPGGSKGFALGLMVEILSGVLTGAALGREVGSIYNTWDKPVNTGHVFIAIHIERLLPLNVFLSRVDQLLDWISSTPKQENVDEIRFPGQIRARYAEEYSRSGIPLPQQTALDLENLAQRLGLETPWKAQSNNHC
ncbi:MAG: Ldh family oxidoreductase [Ignavibacteriae bacterium]|nr:Ldh family oxidoreductase [Ignavibacteriota bacterium]